MRDLLIGQTRNAKLLRGAVVVVALATASTAAFGLPWDIDMADSQAVKAYREPMRPLAEGVVSQPNKLSPKSFTESYSPADPETAALAAPFDATPETLEKGKRMYTIYCTPCHGDGVNLGPVAQPGRVPGVAVLAGPEGRLKRLSDGWVYATIRNGSLSTLMPPYGYMMTNSETWDIVQYVRTLDQSAYVPPAPAPASTETPK